MAIEAQELRKTYPPRVVALDGVSLSVEEGTIFGLLAARLAIVDQGRIVAEGTPDELKSELAGDTIQIELADGEHAAARMALACAWFATRAFTSYQRSL